MREAAHAQRQRGCGEGGGSPGAWCGVTPARCAPRLACWWATAPHQEPDGAAGAGKELQSRWESCCQTTQSSGVSGPSQKRRRFWNRSLPWASKRRLTFTRSSFRRLFISSSRLSWSETGATGVRRAEALPRLPRGPVPPCPALPAGLSPGLLHAQTRCRATATARTRLWLPAGGFGPFEAPRWTEPR